MSLLIMCGLMAFQFEKPNNNWKEESVKGHFENIHRTFENSLLHFQKWEYSQFAAAFRKMN